MPAISQTARLHKWAEDFPRLQQAAQHRQHHVWRRGQERRSRRGPLCRGAEGPEEERRGILSLLFPSEHLHVARPTMSVSDDGGCVRQSVKVDASIMHHCHMPMSLSARFFVKILSICWKDIDDKWRLIWSDRKGGAQLIKNVSHLQFCLFKIYLLVMRGCVEACDYKNYFRGRVSSPFSLWCPDRGESIRIIASPIASV